jgi:hypothetical protein
MVARVRGLHRATKRLAFCEIGGFKAAPRSRHDAAAAWRFGGSSGSCRVGNPHLWCAMLSEVVAQVLLPFGDSYNQTAYPYA